VDEDDARPGRDHQPDADGNGDHQAGDAVVASAGSGQAGSGSGGLVNGVCQSTSTATCPTNLSCPSGMECGCYKLSGIAANKALLLAAGGNLDMMATSPRSLAEWMGRPLRTESRWVVDAHGERFKLAGVNWYGAESATLVPDGLALRHRSDLAKLVRTLGFNSVRIPWVQRARRNEPGGGRGACREEPR